MKQSKDPFEAAYEEEQQQQDEPSPPESPIGTHDMDTQQPPAAGDAGIGIDDDDFAAGSAPNPAALSASARNEAKNKEDEDEEEEEDNMDVERNKFPSNSDPDKSAKMKAILLKFTPEQMSRYESFRRSALQRANMRRLLVSITGTQKISLPMTIVVSGIAKMFVGELVETARIVMTERGESGPIRPCHIREAYRRLKLEGKVPKRSVPRLFR